VGIDLAEFWALLIFSLSYIPYIGAWLGVIFPTALALVQFETLTPFLITAGLLALVQFACGSILEPRIMGKGLNISPMVMLLSLSIWGAIWGVVGMFLAVPLTVVVMIVCSHFAPTRPLAILLSADGTVRT
jgi:predicted PurR-regulated permease PerM